MADGYQYTHGDTPLEGFVIQRAVGRGGFGEVYYAISDAGREVALKAIHGYEQIEVRGVSQCMNLKSPHLVSIFDIKKNAEGKTFVIMEYVNGPSLKELLEQSPAGMGAQKTAFFLRELAKGLSFLHERGIVHRDLKPGNIFYEDGYVKIGDYGLSKAIGVSRHSGQTITVGTVQYMAPEIGMGKYDRSIDIYAMGVVLYEMLTGQVPFFGSSHGEILMKHLMAQPDLTGIEEPFATVIRKSMSKDPAERYQSVQEMVEAVFGAEHVRNSVSCFSPDSLTMVAGRVAQKATVGAGVAGTGSSGRNDGGYGTYKPPITDDSSDVWGRVAQRVDEKASRVRQRLQERGERIRQRHQQRLGEDPVAAGLPGDVDASRDPLNTRQRRTLAMMTSAAVAFGIVWLSGGQVEMGFVSLAMIAILSPALLMADRRFGSRLSEESRWTRRFVYGTSGALAMLVAVPVSAFAYRMSYQGNHNRFDEPGALFASILAALFCIDWSARMSPDRKDRISLSRAFMAGLAAWILGQIFLSHSYHRNSQFNPTAAGILAGISLTVQALAAFDPIAARRRKTGADKIFQGAGVDSPTHMPAASLKGQAPGAGFAPQAAVDHAAYATQQSIAMPMARVVPGWLRGLLLGGFVLFLGTGILMLVAAGAGNFRGDEFGAMVGCGLSALLVSLFCLMRVVRHGYISAWSGFLRPAIRTLCFASILISILVMANTHRLGDDELIIGLGFIIFPVLIAIVIQFIRDRSVDSALSAMMPQERDPARSSQVSDRDAFIAVILACGNFLGVAGLHRFYAGRAWSGLLWLLTFGLFGIGTIIDLVTICDGRFQDGRGRYLRIWLGTGREQVLQSVSVMAASPPTAPPLHPAAQLGRAAGELGRAAGQIAQVPGQVAKSMARGFASASKPWRQKATPRFEPALTSRWLSFPGVLLGFVAVSISVLLALNVPTLIAAGFPDPGLAREFSKAFGYSDWPRLLSRMGEMASVGLGLLAAIIVLVARRRCGAAHVGRVIFATAGFLFAVSLLREACRSIDWYTTWPLLQDHPGPGLENFMDQMQTGNLLFSCLVFFASTVVLAWPEPRIRLNAVAAEAEAS